MGSGWPFQFLPLRSSEGVERLHMFQKITLGQRKTSNGEEFEFVGMSNVSAKPPSGVVRASFQEIFSKEALSGSIPHPTPRQGQGDYDWGL